MRCLIYIFLKESLRKENYYVNCGVLEGFPALRKAVTARL